MMTASAWARAGLLGNPSDGYGGKALSVTVGNFCATVKWTESRHLMIPADHDSALQFDNLPAFTRHIAHFGYYGSDRLIRAALFRFADYCRDRYTLPMRNFTISATSTIPRAVGLAGSSAIVVATLRGLARWYDVPVEPEVLASLALSVERDTLGIPAGLQDRVVQAFEGLMFMDFSTAAMRQVNGLEVGSYERLNSVALPPLYLAYTRHAAEPTEVTHSDLRQRFLAGDRNVISGLQELAELADRGRRALASGEVDVLPALFNRNFDIRRRICRLRPEHVEMVERARAAGASAKYCGSGGAIVGHYDGPATWTKLQAALAPLGCDILPLRVADPSQT